MGMERTRAHGTRVPGRRRALLIALLVGVASAAAIPVAAAEHAHHTSGTLHPMGGSGVTGTGELTSNDGGATYRVHAEGLPPGAVVTVWAVTFNSPENCSGGCDAADLGNAAAGATSRWAGGHVVGANGAGTFAGRLDKGDGSGAVFMPGWTNPAPGLVNTRGAEVHIVLRTHGEKLPGRVADQLSSFGGGCDNTPAAMTGNTGDPGPNTCANIAFVAFVQ